MTLAITMRVEQACAVPAGEVRAVLSVASLGSGGLP